MCGLRLVPIEERVLHQRQAGWLQTWYWKRCLWKGALLLHRFQQWSSMSFDRICQYDQRKDFLTFLILQTFTYTRTENRSCPKATFHIEKNVDAEKCRRACSNRSDCKSVVYNIAEQECRLKKKTSNCNPYDGKDLYEKTWWLCLQVLLSVIGRNKLHFYFVLLFKKIWFIQLGCNFACITQ